MNIHIRVIKITQTLRIYRRSRPVHQWSTLHRKLRRIRLTRLCLHQVHTIMLGKLHILYHNLVQLNKRRPIFLIKLQHEIQDSANIFLKTISQPRNPRRHQLFTVILLTFLVKTGDVFHHRKLIKEQAHRKDITFINIVFRKT